MKQRYGRSKRHCRQTQTDVDRLSNLEEFTINLIRGPRIRFRPEVALLDRMERTSLEKVSARPKADSGSGDGGDETPGA